MKRIIGVLVLVSILVSNVFVVSAKKEVHEVNAKPHENSIQIKEIDTFVPLLSPSERIEVLGLIEEVEKNKSAFIDKSIDEKVVRNQIFEDDLEIEKLERSIKELESELNSLNIMPMKKEDIDALFGRNLSQEQIEIMSEPSIPNETNYVRFYPVRSTYSYGGTSYEVLEIIATCSGYKNTKLQVPFQTYETFIMFPEDNYSSSEFGDILEFASALGEVTVPSAFDKVPLLNYVAEIWNLSTYFNSTHDQVVDGLFRARQTMSYAYVREPGTNWYTHMQSSEYQWGYYTFTFGLSNGTAESVTVNFEIESDNFADIRKPVRAYYAGDLTLEKYKCGSMKIKYDGSTRETFSMPYYSEVTNIPGV